MQTEAQPVPKDFRLVVIVPDEVQQLLPGDNKITTWTATAQEGAETIKWVCNVRPMAESYKSKL